jgi:hypothetical protein
MNLELLPGDYDWTPQGTHIWNEHGFSIVLTEPKTVEMSLEIYNATIGFVQNARISRGLNADGSIPE